MDRPPSNHQSRDEKGQQYTRNNNDTYRSNDSMSLDNRKSYDNSSYRRNSSGPGGNAYGASNRYQQGPVSPQHAMQFTPSSQSANYYDQSRYHPREQQQQQYRPRNNQRSNWQSNQYHQGPQHHDHHQQKHLNNQPNYNHANYDMWTGYPDQYVDRSPSSPGSPGQPDSPSSSQAQGSFGGNSPKHQSPGRGPRVTINPHPTIHPIPQARPKQPNYKSKLEMLCLKNNLQVPQYTAIAARETRYRSSDFYCNLTIGDDKWKTSPKFYPTKEEAEQMVAKKAFNELFNRHRSTATPEECIEMDRELLVDRVMKILSKSKTGYFAQGEGGVEDEFKKKYRTELPSDWINQLTASSDEVKMQVTQVTNKTLTLLTLLTIPHFKLSDEDAKEEWLYAKVRSVNSPNSFWLHLVDQNNDLPEQFKQFSEKMKQFYESSEKKGEILTVDKISKRKFAAIQHTSGWARFQVKQVIKEAAGGEGGGGRSDETDTSGETVTKSEATIENGKNSEEGEEGEAAGESEENRVKDKENTQEKQAKDSNESTENDPSDATSETNETSKDAKSQEEGHKDGEKNNEKTCDTKDASTENDSEATGATDGQESTKEATSSSNEASVVTVVGYLIDFGVKTEIPATYLEVLDDQFYDFPRQAVECSLGLKPVSGRVWTDEVKQQFTSLVLNCSLCMRITDKSHMIIDLVDTRDDNTLNIADELIAKNVAIKCASSPKSELASPMSESVTPQKEEQTPPASEVTESTSEQVSPSDVDSNTDAKNEQAAAAAASPTEQSNEGQPQWE